MPTPTPILSMAAALPIVLLLALLIWRRWTVINATLACLCVATIVAWSLYLASPGHILMEMVKGGWSSVSIIIVIFPAILIYEISLEAGAFPAIRREMTRLVPDPLLRVLTLGWCFSSFLQGPSGFGVPAAVTAPLLMAIGVQPLWSVCIALVGHGWASSFGTLGLGWDTLMRQIDLTSGQWVATALWAGGFLYLTTTLVGICICWYCGGWAGLRHGWPAVGVLGLIMGGGQMALAPMVPSLAAVIPTTTALGVCLLLARMRRYSGGIRIESAIMGEPPPDPAGHTLSMRMSQAMLPYYILVGVSMIALLIPSVRAVLSRWRVGFAFADRVTGLGFVSPGGDSVSPIAWFTHSSFFLIIAALSAAAYYAAKGILGRQEMATAAAQTWRKALPASLSVTLMLAMSNVMGGTGQTETLAGAAAALTGNLYGMVAPMVGVLGAFMTSSNISSNILFAPFQCATASMTGFDIPPILGAQTSGGAIGCNISPSRAVLGAATAGINGQEGAIIRALIPVSLISAVLIGCLVMLNG